MAMAVATAMSLLLYGFLFDRMRETELVSISFLWIGAIAFGAGGLLLAHKGVGPSIGIGMVIAFAVELGLQTFYWLVWPSL